MALDIDFLRKKANDIRVDIINMLCLAGSGHSAGPLGMAEVFAALYFNILKHDPKKPDWQERDRLILSNGHICPVRYAAMAEAGYFPKEELKTLRKINSRLQGHPHNISLPGIENTSGPLGQGTSVAAGLALALKMDGSKNSVYCITSDGEHDEGQTWEAALFAAKYKLGNLIFFMDRNYIQISGNTEDIMPLDSVKTKYRAFNWNVYEIDGHDFKQIIDAAAKARKSKRPTMIICNTIPGKGVSFMEKKYEWHGKSPNLDEAKKALAELGGALW